MKKLLLFVICLGLFSNVDAQKNKDKRKKELSGDEANALLSQLNIDSTAFLRQSARQACECIDSVDKAQKDLTLKAAALPGCIEREVDSYQLALKLMATLKNPGKNNDIILASKNSNEYKTYYYDIERWLKDSCNVLNRLISSNDKPGEKSYSDDPEATKAYNEGIGFFKNEKYKEALPFFEKAVQIDPEFAFAWDNIGVCNRRLGNLDKALEAYKTSLKIDPSGRTALINLPVVYMMQKKTDEAIAAYNAILDHYPGDPEVYYGIALVYYNNKNDMEKSLDNMCKAYNIYVNQKSAFRSDAEKVINMIYANMKKDNKEEVFHRILKENNISSK